MADMKDAAEAAGVETRSFTGSLTAVERFDPANPEWMSQSEAARFDWSTGFRKERKPERPCQRPDCMHTRMELQEALTRAGEIRKLNEELQRKCESYGSAEDGETAGLLQQAALELLDGREQAEARLRLVNGKVQLSVLVYGDDDGAEAKADATEDEHPMPTLSGEGVSVDDDEPDEAPLPPPPPRPPPPEPVQPPPPPAFLELRGRTTLSVVGDELLCGARKDGVLQKTPLVSIVDATVAAVTPFVCKVTITLEDRTEMTFESGNHLAAGRFVTRLKAAAETAQREATPLLATVAPAAADPVPPARPRAPVLLTARVRAGRELRQKLQEAARQYTSHAKGSTAKADQAMAELEATAPTSDEGKRKIQQLGKERVRGLRDTAFSYGGYAVTKEVIARFLELPDVRLLLPAEMQKKQQAAADHETQQVLIDTAKHFIATVYKARGGSSHEARGR